MIINGVDEITIKDIEAFLNDDGTAPPAVKENETTPPATQPGQDDAAKTIENTQAFARRLREEKDKVKEEVAKENGFATYAEMKAAKEAKMFEDKGLDPKEVAPVVEELLKKRLEEDPRLKELDEYKKQKVQVWAVKELEELSTLTDGKISEMKDVPKDVIELWKKKGSLKAAYMELEGEKLIREMRKSIAGEQSKSSTNHLTTPPSTPPTKLNVDKRPMTQKEKEIYKLFNPKATDEEIGKILKDKEN